jgi:hypothetical protein
MKAADAKPAAPACDKCAKMQPKAAAEPAKKPCCDKGKDKAE